ncbi:hypothetical protein NDU88_002327 [Pleurodeles waltl]|uniref:Uncharacterized protein n=1 Tax=Pleurodeles waltl TaxID=8319 RepID=A0AAV7T218_PLEWA|nr:hypothetical protein NDU88_002327 [Pleurodeles waltl]
MLLHCSCDHFSGGAYRNNPFQCAGPGRLLTECGHLVADHREARLSPKRSPGASSRPWYLPRSEERRAAPPQSGSRGLTWRCRPRRERGGRPGFAGARIGGRLDGSRGRLAAPPIAGSRGLVENSRPRQKRSGRSKCGGARTSGARPIADPGARCDWRELGAREGPLPGVRPPWNRWCGRRGPRFYRSRPEGIVLGQAGAPGHGNGDVVSGLTECIACGGGTRGPMCRALGEVRMTDGS